LATAAVAAEEAALAQALAQAGWEEEFDPASRDVYWLNRRLQLSQCASPLCLARQGQACHRDPPSSPAVIVHY
jgi:hypothetical protein